MARSTSDEETKLRKRARRRLIGAIALTTLVVVTLPMVLDNEPRPVGDDIAVQIPSPDSGPYAPKVQADAAQRPGAVPPGPAKASGTVGTAPAPAAGAASATPAPASSRTASAAPSSATPADQKIDVAGAPRPPAEAAAAAAALAAEAKNAAVAAAAARAAEAKAAEAKAGAGNAADAKAAPARPAETNAAETRAAETKADPKDAEAKNFVIQLGAFSEANRARDRHAQLVKAGIRSYTEVIKTPTGDKTRVRAGPFPTRQAAEQANERVKALGMTDGIVVPRRY